MRIKKYVAETMPEALKLVKADLGPKAVILNTRNVKKSSTLGILSKGQVEVTAAVDSGSSLRPKRKAASKPASSAPEKGQMPEKIWATKSAATTPPKTTDPDWADRLLRKIEDLETTIQSSGGAGSAFPPPLGTLVSQLNKAGLDPSLREEVLRTILLDPGKDGFKELPTLQESAARILSQRFKTPRPTRPAKGIRSVITLVGPAGGGKTTGSVRVASHFASKELRSSLVAADTARVGGLDQLRAYGGILDLPVDVARTPEEMGEVIRNRKDTDVLVIDTAGAGPLDSTEIDAVGQTLKEAGSSEIHLVLGASTGLAQMKDAISAYSKIGIDRLLFTKLDETARLGAVCSAAILSGLPVSYTTHGREVPGDFRPGDPLTLCRGLFDRRLHAVAR